MFKFTVENPIQALPAANETNEWRVTLDSKGSLMFNTFEKNLKIKLFPKLFEKKWFFY